MKRVILVLTMLSTLGLVSIVHPDGAMAACHGVNAEYFSSGGGGWEGARAGFGTCDHSDDYNGEFGDNAYDSLNIRVRTRYISGSTSWVYHAWTQGMNTSVNYWYFDNNYYTEYQICRSDGACGPLGYNLDF